MAGVVRVVPEDLAVSAAHVDAHADDLRARHGAADSRIEGAQPGLPIGAAAALDGAVARWQEVTTAHYTQMVRHSTGMRSGAGSYAEADVGSAENLGTAAQAMPAPDLGL